MSTSNNQYGQEIRPNWRDGGAEIGKKLSRLSLMRLTQEKRINNSFSDCTAISFSNRSITRIDDFIGPGSSLRRLDLSGNELTRLQGFSNLSGLSLLNVSNNRLKGDEALEELRYLAQLRTLNVGGNEQIKRLRSHIVKCLPHLQALIANGCGLTKTSFLKFLPYLNTLILSHNELSQWGTREENGNLEKLEKLSLGHNELIAVPDLRSCEVLHELRLNYNSISAKSLEASFYLASTSCGKVLKTLDLSHNKIDDWSAVQFLAAHLDGLTNLGLKGNPLPPPPNELTSKVLREDISADHIRDDGDRKYRHAVLSVFQSYLGKELKPFVRLVVLDAKRVKVKWSQGGAGGEAVGKAKKEADTRSTVQGREGTGCGQTSSRGGEEAASAVESAGLSHHSESGGEKKEKKKEKKRKRAEVEGTGGLEDLSPLTRARDPSDGQARASLPERAPPVASDDTGVIGIKVFQSAEAGGKAASSSTPLLEALKRRSDFTQSKW